MDEIGRWSYKYTKERYMLTYTGDKSMHGPCCSACSFDFTLLMILRVSVVSVPNFLQYRSFAVTITILGERWKIRALHAFVSASAWHTSRIVREPQTSLVLSVWKSTSSRSLLGIDEQEYLGACKHTHHFLCEERASVNAGKLDDDRSAAKMGRESCPTGRANFVSLKISGNATPGV